MQKIAADLDREGYFDCTSLQDGRDRKWRQAVQRQGQPQFREALLLAYQQRCANSGCTCVDVLEAAHIVPHGGRETNHITNGLLLRADLHTLFDLDKIAIQEDTFEILIADTLRGTEYEGLQSKKIRLLKELSQNPDRKALLAHREHAGL